MATAMKQKMLIDLIRFSLLLGDKKVGPPAKDAFELRCFRFYYQANYRLNVSNALDENGCQNTNLYICMETWATSH